MKTPTTWGEAEANYRGRRERQQRENIEAQAAIERFLERLRKLPPIDAREKAPRRGLRVIEGGKTK